MGSDFRELLVRRRGNRGRVVFGGLLTAVVFACAPAWSQVQAPTQADAQPAQPKTPPDNSSLDAPLFYQLLIGEMELSAGRAGSAYEVMLDAARRTRDETLFKRAVDIALQSRAGEQALEATRAWRQAAPDAVDARRYQLQILIALNRLEEAGDPADPYLVTGEATLDTGRQPEFLLIADGQQIDVSRIGPNRNAKTGRDPAISMRQRAVRAPCMSRRMSLQLRPNARCATTTASAAFCTWCAPRNGTVIGSPAIENDGVSVASTRIPATR